MADERFPKRKYLRQLRGILDDLDAWSTQYAAAADEREHDWLRGQFEERINVLRNTRVAVSDAFMALEELPRLR